MKRFALILLLLCVAGCAVPTGTLAGKKDTTEIIKNSEYAYVLVGVSGCAGSNWLHTSLPYTQKPKNDEMMWIPGSSTKCGERYQLNILKPGKYTLIHYAEVKGNWKLVISTEAQEQNEVMKHTGSRIGSFTVDKGTVTYIGTLNQETDFDFRSYKFTVSDEMEAAKAYLSENYPDINPEIIIYRPALYKG